MRPVTLADLTQAINAAGRVVIMGTPTFDGPEPEDPDLLPDPSEAGGDLAERRDLGDSSETSTAEGGRAHQDDNS